MSRNICFETAVRGTPQKSRPIMTDRFVRRGSWFARCLTDKGIEFVVGRTLKLGLPHASCHVSQEGRRSFWTISNNGLMKSSLACVFDGTCCATDTQGLVWFTWHGPGIEPQQRVAA